MLDLRLVAPALVAWATSALLTAVPRPVWPVVIALWCLAAVAAAMAIMARGRRVPAAVGAFVAVTAMAAALAGLAVSSAMPERRPDALDRLDRHTVVVHGTVTAPAQAVAAQSGAASSFGGERVRVGATVTSLAAGGLSISARIPAQLYAPAGTRVDIGERIEATGTLAVLPPTGQVTMRIYASGAPHRLAPAPPALAVANTLRADFSRVAARLPGDGGALLPGLAIGDVHDLPASLNEAMKQASLTHLTAVSGANCAVVVALVSGAAGLVGAGRAWRVLASLLALGGFVVLVTPQPSVLRAAVMATVIIVAAWSGRNGRAVPALCLAVIVLLIVDPWLARDFGFVLSVLATGALLLLAPPLADRLARWMPSRLAAVVAIPIAAQLACQPVLLLLTPALPVYGVPANLLAEPAAPVATVLGLVSCLFASWWPAAAMLTAWLAWAPAAWIAGIARVAASLPLHSVTGVAGAAGMLCVLAATVAVVMLVLRPARRVTRVARAMVVIAGFGLVGSVAAGAAGADLGERATRPGDWVIAACDIGQGDAVIVRSAGAVALIDTGPEPHALASCLHELGLTRVDLLVLTHYDMDHIGGLDAVLGKVDIALVGPMSDPRAHARTAALRKAGAQVHVATAGDAGRLGAASWRVLWPDGKAHGLLDGNERSVAMLFDGDGIRSLFLGDLDERAQSAFLRAGTVPRVDVVKVAHHGSADQDPALYRRAAAGIALVSCGADNDYGHPTRSALSMLAAAQSRVFRTDMQGLVLVSSAHQGGLRVWTQRVASRAHLDAPGRSVSRRG
jgi:competence protein ComEC